MTILKMLELWHNNWPRTHSEYKNPKILISVNMTLDSIHKCSIYLMIIVNSVVKFCIHITHVSFPKTWFTSARHKISL